ncbi:MAG: PAS-domain containing protein, partial [Stellaceae bacterium]
YTKAGIARRLIQLSRGSNADGDTVIILNERSIEPRPADDRDGELVRAFAQAGADWFWETDGALRITLVSDRFDLSQTSISADFVGRLVYEALPGIDDLDYEALRNAVQRRESFRDFRYTRRDGAGHRRHYSVSGAPIFGIDGAFLGYRGTGRDRTRSVEAEEQAAIAQARLVATIESIPETFILFDRELRFVMCNNRFREENAAIARLLRAGTAAQELAKAARRGGTIIPAIDYVLESAPEKGGQSAVERRAGDRWFQVGARRLPEGGLAVVQTDVTALKQREAELAEKSALLQATLDNMHQGVLVNDGNARVVMWNKRFLEMNGLPPGTIQAGMKATELVRAAAMLGEYGAGATDNLTERRLKELRRDTADSLRVRPDGSVIEHHTNRMPDGGLIRTFTDVTELKHQQRRFDEQHRLLAAVLENMDQGIMVMDADGRTLMWNERLIEQYGLPKGFFRVGMPMPEIVDQLARRGELGDGDPALVATARLAVLNDENNRVFSRRLRNGTVIERRRRDMPGGGSVLTHTDITGLIEREDELAHQHGLVAGTLANVDQGILVADAELRIVLWNDRLLELLGLPGGVCRVGMPMRDVIAYLRQRQGLAPDD